MFRVFSDTTQSSVIREKYLLHCAFVLIINFSTMCLAGILYGYCCDQWGNYQLTPLPLIGASSTVKIVDSVAQVELKQRYENQVSCCNDFLSLISDPTKFK